MIVEERIYTENEKKSAKHRQLEQIQAFHLLFFLWHFDDSIDEVCQLISPLIPLYTCATV